MVNSGTLRCDYVGSASNLFYGITGSNCSMTFSGTTYTSSALLIQALGDGTTLRIISGTYTSNANHIGSAINVMYNSPSFTLEGGTISGYDCGLCLGGNVSATLKGGTIIARTTSALSGTSDNSSAVDVQGGNCTISGTTIKGGYCGVTVFGGTITMNSGSVTGDNDVGFYVPAGTLRVNGGTVKGKKYGIYRGNGSVTISGNASVTGGTARTYNV